jgi:hypothetical protein
MYEIEIAVKVRVTNADAMRAVRKNPKAYTNSVYNVVAKRLGPATGFSVSAPELDVAEIR